jgi:predicted AlkP superfamily phosphohydrolase/phosphomutase
VWPPELEATVRAVDVAGGPHPFSAPHLSPEAPTDPRELAALASACVSGLRRRADLALRIMADCAPDVLLAVFTEVHRASHYLWPMIDPAHPELEPPRRGDGGGRDLTAIFRELDRQIGRLVDAAGPETTILVFSLHGMRPTQGVPGVLAPLLEHAGLARTLPWHSRSGSGRLRAAVGLARRWVPRSLKRRYHRLAGQSVVHRVAQQTLLPAYDWSRTVAFSLPTDQHGYVRVNLAGREARGIVARSDYEAVCRRLEQLLLSLRTEAGEPVVKAVLSTAAASGGTPPDKLPDLVVHWEDAACVPELRLMAPPLVCPSATELKQTGQHAPDGFFLLRPARGATMDHGDAVAAEDLHRLIEAAGVTGS